MDRIWVQYSRDSLAGSWEEDEWVDATASVEAYGRSLAASLEETYSNATVEVEAGTGDQIRIDGESDHPAVGEVRGVMTRVRDAQNWVRYTQEGVRHHLAGGLDAETDDGTTASAREVERDGAPAYMLSWDGGMFSREKQETFETEEALLAAMVKVAPWHEWYPRNP